VSTSLQGLVPLYGSIHIFRPFQLSFSCDSGRKLPCHGSSTIGPPIIHLLAPRGRQDGGCGHFHKFLAPEETGSKELDRVSRKHLLVLPSIYILVEPSYVGTPLAISLVKLIFLDTRIFRYYVYSRYFTFFQAPILIRNVFR
jgi:hypothetical protein